MKQILNFILTAAVLYLAAHFFPTYVQIADFKTLILATLLIVVADILVVLIIFAIMAVSVFSGNWVGLVGGFVSIFFAQILALSLVETWLPGLTLGGFGTKLLLAVALSIFRFPENTNNNN